ncbi:hypothetical protein MBAV_003881 [Candidatus Magnetobacterium bavaricum]|uniref:Uncharacterized protein n=1 Tax=Candidatus Magnetobacterium bavaricum TaxID=29290 RepID=A0A0F3GPL5_9BACT|nr:hypothetical protein MBAV_003881 [Candidatus Magnetobacterium bavaricum]
MDEENTQVSFADEAVELPKLQSDNGGGIKPPKSKKDKDTTSGQGNDRLTDKPLEAEGVFDDRV